MEDQAWQGDLLEHCRVRGLVLLLVQRDPVPVLGTRGRD